jgi:transcriptional regulator with XRE-family HTH domain
MLRERAGLTQNALAQASGVPIGSLRNYEQGQREPYWHVVFQLAGALGVSVEEFHDCLPDEASKAEKPSRKAEAANRGGAKGKRKTPRRKES